MNQRSAMNDGLVLTGVTIVDTHDGKLARDRNIVVDKGKIVQIGPSERISASGSAKSIDAAGKFVIPGYLDMHAHPLNPGDPEGSLTMMLANGITGFRQMSGTAEALQARRLGKLMPPIDAPELLEMSGEILTAANAGSLAAGVTQVQQQKAQGADFIKVIDVSPDVFFAALAESTRLNLPFVGHLPPSVNVADAVRAGMRSIEHLGPKDSILLGCSTDEAALRHDMEHRLPRSPQITGPIPTDVILRAVASPNMFTDASEFLRSQRVVDTYSADRTRELAAHFVATGTWLVPTLSRIRTMTFVDDQRYRTDPDLRCVPLPMQQMWQELAQQFPQRLSASARETLQQLFVLKMQLVRPFKDAGVKMLAGSDSGATAAWCIPGFGLHHEFDLLEEAGLSPLEILQMTTLNGAEFLGRQSTMGSVEEGKDANLVLLDANPIASVQNLHRIAAVVRCGNYHSTDALRAMADKTEARLATGFGSPASYVRTTRT